MIPGRIDECVRDATGVVFPDESRGVTTWSATMTIIAMTIAIIAIIIAIVLIASSWIGCLIVVDSSRPPIPPPGG
jgi:hypothetical protein